MCFFDENAGSDQCVLNLGISGNIWDLQVSYVSYLCHSCCALFGAAQSTNTLIGVEAAVLPSSIEQVLACVGSMLRGISYCKI